MLKDPETKASKWSDTIIDVICDYCGNEFQQKFNTRTEVNRRNKINQKDSCKNCSNLKREETSLLKYGTKVPSQSAKVKQKSSLTKGGKGLVVEDYKDKILEMYAKPNISVKTIADTLGITRSVLIKYMKELGLETKGDIQAKAKQTCIEKYGVEHYIQSKEGKEKLKQTNLEKYGCENLYDNPELKEQILAKSRETCLEKYGVEYVVSDPSRQDEFEQKRKAKRIQNGQIIYKNKTAKELAESLGLAMSTFYERVQKWGLEIAVSKDKHTTYIELIIKNWLDAENIPYKTQVNIGGKIADFVIDNLVIETDGLYYHSDAVQKNNNYHIEKRNIYLKNGYTPLFFREDELINKLDIVKSIINNKLGRSKRIFARKCLIKNVGKTEAKRFFQGNHLMGKGQGLTKGLYYNNELVCAIQYKKIRGDHHEISRFCNVLNTNIIGGFSRLVKQLPKPLTTYIDLRYGSGTYLKDLGFEYMGAHPSFKWTDGKNCFHRLKYRGNSGYNLGLLKIWDCGQAKWCL